MSIDALQDEIRNFPGTAGQPPGQVRLWWRDDDLVANTPAFDRLVGLATERRLPLLVSVIPGLASDRLDLSRADPGLLFFCQHGWKHLNHEPEGAPKSEFGASRPSAEVQSELAAGQAVMGRLLGERVMPVFVPPWNALDASHLDTLAACGFTGLSTYAGQHVGASRLRLANARLDLLCWDAAGGPQSLALDAALGRIVELLRLQRLAGRSEPIGLLTHHRAMNAEAWAILEGLLAALVAVPGLAWVSPPELFAGPAA